MNKKSHAPPTDENTQRVLALIAEGYTFEQAAKQVQREATSEWDLLAPPADDRCRKARLQR
jgi:hypothetical protein